MSLFVDAGPTQPDEFESVPTFNFMDVDEVEQMVCGLQHTVECKFEDHQICPVWFCTKYRKILIHIDNCVDRIQNTCVYCRHIISIIAQHGVNCKDDECNAPFCVNVQRVVRDDQLCGVRVKNMEHLVTKVCQTLRVIRTELEVEDEMVEHREPSAMLTDDMDWEEGIDEEDGSWDGQEPKVRDLVEEMRGQVRLLRRDKVERRWRRQQLGVEEDEDDEYDDEEEEEDEVEEDEDAGQTEDEEMTEEEYDDTV